MKKEFPVLYKYTQTGAVQQWQIVVQHDRFYTIEGQVDGKLTTSLPTICVGKNIGKKNQTSPMEQALAEATAKHQKKLDKGYNEVLTAEKKYFEPMLAKDAKESKDLPPIENENEEFKVVVFGQQKLDGLRCVNEDNTLMSRNGKPYIVCPHLYQDKVTLDGELYNHDLHADFNKIVSLCKKTKPTEEEIKESAEKVEFWAYDFPSHPGNFDDRIANLGKFIREHNNPSIKLVPTVRLHNWKEVKEFHGINLINGYEGTILRINGPYENKRSKYLLKYKDFIDEEFKIVEYEEGTGGRTGTIGFFVLQHDKNPNQTFKSNVKGDFDYLRQVWKDRDTYIGATATVKYFQRTPKQDDGTGDVPRFPYIVKLKREEYE